MVTTEVTTEVLHDLIAIHNDRHEGYERAIKELGTENTDLVQLFESMLQECGEMKTALENRIHEFEDADHTHEGTTFRGKLYRAWMDVKSALSGNTRKAVLESCEYGEDKMQEAYEFALSEEGLDIETRTLLLDQQRTLMTAHNRIKSLRNAEQ